MERTNTNRAACKALSRCFGGLPRYAVSVPKSGPFSWMTAPGDRRSDSRDRKYIGDVIPTSPCARLCGARVDRAVAPTYRAHTFLRPSAAARPEPNRARSFVRLVPTSSAAYERGWVGKMRTFTGRFTIIQSPPTLRR